MRYVELRRHTDNDGDALTPDGPCAAEEIGRDRLNPPYPTLVSTGAARATQMLKILRSAAGQEARARRAAMDAHIVQKGVGACERSGLGRRLPDRGLAVLRHLEVHRGSRIIVPVLRSFVGHTYTNECPRREEPRP